MPAFEVIVQVLKDGVNLSGFPFRRTIETNEGSDYNSVKIGGDTPLTFTAFPNVSSPLQLVVVAPDQAIQLKVAGLSTADGIIQLLAGGLFLLLDCNQTPAANAPPLLICNSGVNTVNLKGATGGP
jgi:hypothetical protein